mmetsp:Transcript_43738/g.83492  ORF Transcript_43738/g.83492 Transcript_43738/m.83492 type:complete len:219 (+) Transcript_43738:143-799(+)|eukprot:CAMPEP_0114252616 /NCGR_PEP_ID=MMETSP0058-20121206/15933_1 /TAXON_ID=36894 /ORGANISM="Pyramimonas parkeae, CCMP726" /LENGTH=218 /DNA_ID=CAMNT_0001366565 /DNA_START=120 /DNA_END=776 /DNA_ORIENTATION=-
MVSKLVQKGAKRIKAQAAAQKRELLEVPEEIPNPASLLLASSGVNVNKPKVVPRPDFKHMEVSSVLSKLQEFLPKISDANQELLLKLKKGGAQDELDIEHLAEDQKAHISMDLTCGVLELQTEDAVQKATKLVGADSVVSRESRKSSKRGVAQLRGRAAKEETASTSAAEECGACQESGDTQSNQEDLEDIISVSSYESDDEDHVKEPAAKCPLIEEV